MKDLQITMDEPANWMEKTGGYAKDMLLRDYFATAALNALYQDYVNQIREDGDSVSLGAPGEPGICANLMARESYAIADAMLKAREEYEA